VLGDSLLRLLHSSQPPSTEVTTAIIVTGFARAHTATCSPQLTPETTLATKQANTILEVDRMVMVVG
jgi:hypothetical protein